MRAILSDVAHDDLARESAPAGVTVHAIEALTAGAPGARRPAWPGEVDLEAPATIIFTSGTTGRPKAAVLSHGNHAASADAWASVLGPPRPDRWLSCLPLFHVAGLAIIMRASAGARRWRWRSGSTQPRSRRIAAGVTHLSLVPTQLEQLLAARRGRPAPTTLRALLLGGGPIPTAMVGALVPSGYRC